jgi:RHS repeat-associated protein
VLVQRSAWDGDKFTGKERDTESGLDNFGARYYASTMGRFMTPDWAARPTSVPYAVFGDPQSLNLYGYVRNDPVTQADADGHDPAVPMGPLEDNSGTTYNEERAETLTGKGEKAAEVATAAAPALVEGGAAALAAAANKLLTVAVDFLGVLVDAVSVPAMVVLTPTQLNSDENAQMAKIHAAEDNAGPKAADAPGVSAGGQKTDAHGNKLGPSGKPQVNETNSNTREAARNRALGQGSGAVEHSNPRVGRPHWHPTDSKGNKKPSSTHNNYPED